MILSYFAGCLLASAPASAPEPSAPPPVPAEANSAATIDASNPAIESEKPDGAESRPVPETTESTEALPAPDVPARPVAAAPMMATPPVPEAPDADAEPERGVDPATPAAAGASHRYVVGDPAARLGGFGGVRIRPTGIGPYFGVFVGGAGGLIVGDVFVGGAGYGLFHDTGDYRLSDDTRLDLSMGYGGLLVGGEFARRKALAFAAQGFVGAGGACIAESDAVPGSGACLLETSLFVVEPEFAMHITISRPFRLGLSLGYRFVITDAWAGPRHFALSGPTGALEIDFGWF